MTPPLGAVTFLPHSTTDSHPDVQRLLLALPVSRLSIAPDDCAHGSAALRQSDATADMLGRLTVNPIRQLSSEATLPHLRLFAGSPGAGTPA